MVFDPILFVVLAVGTVCTVAIIGMGCIAVLLSKSKDSEDDGYY